MNFKLFHVFHNPWFSVFEICLTTNLMINTKDLAQRLFGCMGNSQKYIVFIVIKSNNWIVDYNIGNFLKSIFLHMNCFCPFDKTMNVKYFIFDPFTSWINNIPKLYTSLFGDMSWFWKLMVLKLINFLVLYIHMFMVSTLKPM